MVTELKRRRGGGEELLAWREGRRWIDVKSRDVNAVREGGRRAASSPPRTSAPGAPPCWPPWRCRCPAWPPSGSKTARKRAKTRAIKETAELPRQHAGRLPRLLHRPAGVRPLRRRAHDRRRAAGAGRGHGRVARRPGPCGERGAGPARRRPRARTRWPGEELPLDLKQAAFGSGCGASGAPGSGVRLGRVRRPGSTGAGLRVGHRGPGAGARVGQGLVGAGGAGTSACGASVESGHAALVSGAARANRERRPALREPKLRGVGGGRAGRTRCAAGLPRPRRCRSRGSAR